MGFVKFDKLVWASTVKEKEAQLKGTPIKKESINKEFVFDFTLEPRTEDVHGYIKSSSEFYFKADKLGEFAIFIEPWIAFSIVSFVLALAFGALLTVFMPTSIGIMALLFDRQIDETKIKIRLQNRLYR